MPLKIPHLLQSLHKLVHGDGATQQRLQRFALGDIITHPLPLLAGRGLGRFWRELMDEKIKKSHSEGCKTLGNRQIQTRNCSGNENVA